MANPPSPFSPDDLQLSKLRFFSLGIVAANKPLSSTLVEITPTEALTMLDGDLDDAQSDTTESGVGYGGKDYTVSAKTSLSIQADWLRLGYGNRRTAPDVRRGAQVVLYQFGDMDKYYWTTLQDDAHLRKLETVIYAWSGTKSESETNGAGNSYFLEISTHKGVTTFHTSKANGEFCTFDIQINSKEGRIMIVDDVGNSFLFDAQAHQLRMENVDGSVVDITREIATITTNSEINMKTSHLTIDADKGDFNVEAMSIKGSTLKSTSADVTFTGSSFKVASGNTDIS